MSVLQGKGTMHTFWLSGIYNTDESMCLEPDELERLINDDKTVSDKPEDDADTVSNIKTVDKYGGKVSICDSGIGIDKGFDDKFENVFFGIDSIGTCEEKYDNDGLTTMDDKCNSQRKTTSKLTSEKNVHLTNEKAANVDSHTSSDGTRENLFSKRKFRNNFTGSIPQAPATEKENFTILNLSERKQTDVVSHNPIVDGSLLDSRRASWQRNVIEVDEQEIFDNNPDIKTKMKKQSQNFSRPVRIFATNFMKVQNNWLTEN